MCPVYIMVTLPSVYFDHYHLLPGWQMLREHTSGAHQKVRVLYERKDPQHTLFTRFLKDFHRALNESHLAFVEL